MNEEIDWNNGPDGGYMMTIDEWKESVESGGFIPDDGHGRWLKDGKPFSNEFSDDVFGPVPEGVTHVEWFNK